MARKTRGQLQVSLKPRSGQFVLLLLVLRASEPGDGSAKDCALFQRED